MKTPTYFTPALFRPLAPGQTAPPPAHVPRSYAEAAAHVLATRLPRAVDEAAARLLSAIEPVTAYLDRAVRPSRHAEQVEELVNAALDLGEAADALLAGPDWEAIAGRMLTLVPTPAPTPLMVRVRAHLAALTARAAEPQAQRMNQTTITSHHLGLPERLA